MQPHAVPLGAAVPQDEAPHGAAAPQNTAPQGAAARARARLSRLRPEHIRTSQVRESLVGKEVDRLSGAGRPALPDIPLGQRIDRGVAAYANGAQVRGLRVEAYNAQTRVWSMGTIQSVHVRAHRRSQEGRGMFVIACITHDDAAIRPRAYEVSFLRLV